MQAYNHFQPTPQRPLASPTGVSVTNSISPLAGQENDPATALMLTFIAESKNIQEQFPQVLQVSSTMPSQTALFRYAVLMEHMRLRTMNELYQKHLIEQKRNASSQDDARHQQSIVRDNIQQLFKSIATNGLKKLQPYDAMLPSYFQATPDQNSIIQLLYLSTIQANDELVIYDTLRIIQQMRLETMPTNTTRQDVSQLLAEHQKFYSTCDALVRALPETLQAVALTPTKTLNFRYTLLEAQHLALYIHTTCSAILRSQSSTAQLKELAQKIRAEFSQIMDQVVERIYAICNETLLQQDAQLASFGTKPSIDLSSLVQFLFRANIRNRVESLAYEALQTVLHTRNIQLL